MFSSYFRPSALLVLVTLSLILRGSAQPNAAPDVQTTPARPLDPATKPAPTSQTKVSNLTKGPWNLPTCGFSLSLPAGWQARTKKVRHRVLEGLLRNSAGQPRQILIVEMGVSDANSLRNYVNLFLRDGNAQLLPGSVLLDKRPAYRLKMSGLQPGMSKVWAQQQVIVATQGKQTFTIIVMADKSEKIEETVKAIQNGWHWQPFASPASYLQLSPEALPFPQGQLQLSVPRSMGVYSLDETGMMLSAYDARINIAALTLNVASISGPKPLSLSAMRQNFGAVLQAQLDLPRPLIWKDAIGQPSRTMSNFFELPLVVPDLPGPSLVSYGFVKRKGNDWVLLTFNINAQDAKSRVLYQAAAKKILDSIRDEPANTASG